jgi:hypothetical protein
MYRTVFAVRGNGRFPYDMLRYDRCTPAESSDVINMEDYDMERTVNLVTFHKYQKAIPVHERRWESFLWKVIRQSKPQKVV